MTSSDTCPAVYRASVPHRATGPSVWALAGRRDPEGLGHRALELTGLLRAPPRLVGGYQPHAQPVEGGGDLGRLVRERLADRGLEAAQERGGDARIRLRLLEGEFAEGQVGGALAEDLGGQHDQPPVAEVGGERRQGGEEGAAVFWAEARFHSKPPTMAPSTAQPTPKTASARSLDGHFGGGGGATGSGSAHASCSSTRPASSGTCLARATSRIAATSWR